MEKPRFKVSDFLDVLNQTLDYAYPMVEIEGEVASFKINQDKFVFFDLKDAESSVSCFMMKAALRQPIEDGMKVLITAQPKLTKWGRFSLTVRSIRPIGEGSLKKSFELLKQKLDREGLFDPARRRVLPVMPRRVAVISSQQAAGYADFMKIANDRWGGIQFEVAQVQVQGETAPEQVMRALEYFNAQSELADVIVIIRGGGSVDDLAAFNDERLVRAVAASRIPTLVGIGHETDVTLCDLAADIRAATPSNAAEILTPDRRDIIRQTKGLVYGMGQRFKREVTERKHDIQGDMLAALEVTKQRHANQRESAQSMINVLRQLDPSLALQRGYALVRGVAEKGREIEIERSQDIIIAEVKDVKTK